MADTRRWMLSSRPIPLKAPDDAEIREIVAACEAFITEVLKPRFLRPVIAVDRNYCIDIHGAWRAGRYRFMRRYRSGMDHNRGFEFDAPFARLDRKARDQFDIFWMRHTGKWWPVYAGMTLAEALHILETDPVLRPL